MMQVAYAVPPTCRGALRSALVNENHTAVPCALRLW